MHFNGNNGQLAQLALLNATDRSQFILQISAMNYQKKLKYFLGWIMSNQFPARAKALQESFTIPDYVWSSHKSSLVDRLIRFYLIEALERQEKTHPGSLEAVHKSFWEKQNTFYEAAQSRTEEVYIPAYKDIVEDLKLLLIDRKIQTICEFGVGDGKWLNYLSQELTSVQTLIGIDLSEQQIKNNQSRYSHLKFYQADLLEWVKKEATPRTVYHTNSGVLEYLSEGSVVHLFETLKQQAPGSLLLLIEPLYGGYDIDKDFGSKIIGDERSYSHNYVSLLKSARIAVMRYEERNVLEQRMLIVLASTD